MYNYTRYAHSASVFGIGSDFKVVVVFGGISSNTEISTTTLLLMCKCNDGDIIFKLFI